MLQNLVVKIRRENMFNITLKLAFNIFINNFFDLDAKIPQVSSF